MSLRKLHSKWLQEVDEVAHRCLIGLAQHVPPEAMKELFNRADVEMYRQKVKGRTSLGRDEIGFR